jgi:hypothetical protein
MSIVATEIESIHGVASGQRFIYYRCQDDAGVWRSVGPVITFDPNFDADAHKAVVAEKMEESLAVAEFQEIVS